MSGPVRIQLSRKKGWKMPPNTVKVCRPSMWGNPWSVRDCASTLDLTMNAARYQVVEWFKDWLSRANDDEMLSDLGCYSGTREQHAYIRANISKLKGKNLACFCKTGEPCHADVLLKIANAPSPSSLQEQRQ